MEKKAKEIRDAEEKLLDSNCGCDQLRSESIFSEFSSKGEKIEVQACLARGLGAAKVLLVRPLILADSSQVDKNVEALIVLRHQNASTGTVEYGPPSGEPLTYEFNKGVSYVPLRPNQTQRAKVNGERQERIKPIRVPIVAKLGGSEYAASVYVFGAHD